MLVNASARNSEAVTASDSTVINCDALYIGNGGDLAIKHVSSGATITYVGLPAGAILPLKLIDGRVMAATTATSIVAMSW